MASGAAEVNRGRAELLALEMAKGRTLADAAKSLGIAERTARRWYAEPAFRPRVDDLRRRLIDDAIGKLAEAASEAVSTLVALLKPGNPPTVRLGASRGVLSALIDIQSHADLSDRIAALEDLTVAKP